MPIPMICDLRVWTLGALIVIVSACGIDKATVPDGGTGGGASGGSVGSGGAGGTAAVGGGGGIATAAGGRAGSPSSGGRGGATAETGGASGQGGRGGQGGGGLACSFSSTVTITEWGGLVGLVRTTTLTPPASYRVQGRQTQGMTPSCMPALPVCGSASLIDASDLERAVTHPDVETALSTNALYGNLDVLDGSAWRVARSSGGAFDLSNFEVACTPSARCIPAPEGVKALIQVIRNVNTQQLADPSCAGVGN